MQRMQGEKLWVNPWRRWRRSHSRSMEEEIRLPTMPQMKPYLMYQNSLLVMNRNRTNTCSKKMKI